MQNDAQSQEDAFGTPGLKSERPRYFFDVSDGDRLTVDDEGLEMDDLHGAQQAAVAALPQVARDALPDGTRRDFVVEVRDASGRKVIRATLALTVEQLL
jgi:hypothetical protein